MFRQPKQQALLELTACDSDSATLLFYLFNGLYEEARMLLTADNSFVNSIYTNTTRHSIGARDNCIKRFLADKPLPEMNYIATPLISVLISQGKEEAVRLLVEFNANLKKTDRNGHTPLDYAREYQQTEIESYLKARIQQPKI